MKSTSRFLWIALLLLPPVHAMRGLVEDSVGHGLPDVEVRASWTETPETTDVFGTWTLANPVSVSARAGQRTSWNAEGLVFELDAPAEVSIELFDAAGTNLSSLRRNCQAGRTVLPIPEFRDRTPRFVRVEVDGKSAVVVRGSSLPVASAGRSTEAIHALSFRKEGFVDQLRLVDADQDTVRTILHRIPIKRVAKVEPTPDSGVRVGWEADVSLRSATDSVTFFYTLDGSIPTWDTSTFLPSANTNWWRPGQAAIQLRKSAWLTVVAARRGWTPSEVFLGRYVFIGDTSLVEDFEATGLSGNGGGAGLTWFACQHANGDGCIQDQVYSLERTTPRLDTLDESYNHALGRRAWRIQVSMNKHGENLQAAYAGGGLRVPPKFADAAYRLVFWAKWQDTTSRGPTTLPFLVEMATRHNANNNGGYADGFHRRVASVSQHWKRFEVDFTQFYAGGNGYSPKASQPESTSTNPANPAWFFADPTMASLGLSGWQGNVQHNQFEPSWIWGVSKEVVPRWEDIIAFRFSVMQPMSAEAAATVGPASPSWKDPREQSLTPSQIDALVKGIGGYLWIDNVRLVRKAI